jgi:hypothetical protein
LARFDLLGSRLDKLLQGLVLDVGGAPLGDRELRQIAAEFHIGETKDSRLQFTILSGSTFYLQFPTVPKRFPIEGDSYFNLSVTRKRSGERANAGRGNEPRHWNV